MAHHTWAGTDKDPDRSLVAPFPISRAALARKLGRDLVGISGLRRIVGLALMDLEILEYNVSGDARRNPTPGHPLRAAAKNLDRTLVTNLALFGILFAQGHGRLPQLHRLLESRGSLKSTVVSPGYLDVLKTVTTRRFTA